MRELSLVIFELLAISLGVDRVHYSKFFEDGNSIMRCNYYPPCNNSGLILGTGPHCDPTSLTILHQDQVGGLEVFTNNKWQAVRPRQDALVINIGDTFMVSSPQKSFHQTVFILLKTPSLLHFFPIVIVLLHNNEYDPDIND